MKRKSSSRVGSDQLGGDDYYDDDDAEDYDSQKVTTKKKGQHQKNGYDDDDDDGRNGYHQQSYRVREVNISQIPSHLLQRLTQAKGNGGEAAALTAEDAEGSAGDGAWIIQCPKDVDLCSALEGKKISLDGNPTVLSKSEDDEGEDGVNGGGSISETYETVASRPANDVKESLLMLLPQEGSGFRIVSVPFQGFINVRLHIDDIGPPEIVPAKKKKRKLPSGIKERHCFLRDPSCTYVTKKRDTTKMAQPVQDKQLIFQSTKLKHGYSPVKQLKQETIDSDDVMFIEPHNADSPSKKKKKKKKHHEEPEVELIEEIAVGQETPKKKKKKDKKSKEESVEVVEEEVSVITPLELSPKKPKKSKKHKSSSEPEEIQEIEPEPIIIASENISKQSKKKKHKLKSEVLEVEPEPIIYESTTSPKKKSKQKRKAEEMEHESPSPKNSKKHKKLRLM